MSYVGRILNPAVNNFNGYSGGTINLTSSGTWTCPAGLFTINLQVVGSGGGGSGAASGVGAGGGGAGGQSATSTNVSVVPGTSYTYTIGAGGTGSAGGSTSTNGGNGNTTSIVINGVTYSAAGGGGAQSGSSGGAGGTGGGASGGSASNPGGTGGNGANSSAGGSGGTGGAGAGSLFGGGGGGGGAVSNGGNGGAGSAVGSPGNGSNGAANGGSGGGGGGNGLTGQGNGGNGGSGVIVITSTSTNLNFNPQSTTTNIATAGNSIAMGFIQSTSNNTDHLIGQYVAAPATPYCVIANLSMNQGDMAGFTNFATKVYGIGFYDGAKAVTSVSAWNSPNPATMLGGVFEWSNINSISNTFNYNRKASGFPTGTLNWIQIEDDGTNIRFFYGCDGTPTKAPTHWVQYYSQGRTSYLSNVNYICFMTDFAGNSIVGSGGFQDSYLTLKSWQIIKL